MKIKKKIRKTQKRNYIHVIMHENTRSISNDHVHVEFSWRAGKVNVKMTPDADVSITIYNASVRFLHENHKMRGRFPRASYCPLQKFRLLEIKN